MNAPIRIIAATFACLALIANGASAESEVRLKDIVTLEASGPTP